MGRSAAGAREVWCGEGVSPYSLAEGSEEGSLPPPQKIFGIFLLKIPYFDAF